MRSAKHDNDEHRDKPETQSPPQPAPAFSMTNEEADIDAFRDYLGGVAPEALWDVRAHLDAERYPRRFEAVHREMRRRGLFFVTPYTERELKIRALSAWGLGLALFAASLRAINIADARLQTLGAIRLHFADGEETPFFVNLATGGARAARFLLPFALPAAAVVGLATVGAAVYAVALQRQGRLRPEVALIALIASAGATGLLWWTWRAAGTN